jgi:thioredoxin-like negative regulator of GroEL
MRRYITLHDHDYHQRLAATPGLGLVFFSSPECGACRRVEALLPDAAPEAARLYKVDAQRDAALARAFDIFHLPDLFLYRDGQFHARLDCAVTPASLGRAIDAALAAPAQEEP